MNSPQSFSPSQSPDSPGFTGFPDLTKPLKLSFFNDEIIEHKRNDTEERRGSQ